MKKLVHSIITAASIIPVISHAQEWGGECVGYYEFELPKNIEVALYAVKNVTNPPSEPISIRNIPVQRTRNPVVTFGDAVYERSEDRVQAQFSKMIYGKFEIGVTSYSNTAIDFGSYRNKVESDYQFAFASALKREKQRFEILHEPLTPKHQFERMNGYLIKDYAKAFAFYEFRGYAVQINNGHRLYQFWGLQDEYNNDGKQSPEIQLRKSEGEVYSLLSSFSARKLHEVPKSKGFCIPYGFISENTGQEKHNIAVTFRLKENPDVSIFIQDLGMEPSDGFKRPKGESEKDFITYLWNRKYQWGAVSKELISPKWRTIEMDGRKGLGTFAKAKFKDGRVDYGYVAYVRGNHNARNVEPDLLVYVMQYGVQAKDRSPMDKKELEKMAERIVGSVKRR